MEEIDENWENTQISAYFGEKIPRYPDECQKIQIQ